MPSTPVCMIGMMIVSGYLFKKMSENPLPSGFLSRHGVKEKHQPLCQKLVLLYGGELGIRTLGSFWEHSISSAAPSTTRTTLRVYFRPVFFPEICSKIRWRENRRDGKKYSILRFSVLRNIKENQGDEIPSFRRNFECRTFDLSDNSPYTSSVILAPEECKKNTQERYEIVKSEPAQSPVRRTFQRAKRPELPKISR